MGSTQKKETSSAAAPEPAPKSDKSQKSKVSFEGAMAREEAVAYFEALVAGLKKGTITIRQGSESISLSPSARVDVEVKAARKPDKAKIAFEISWGTSAPAELAIAAGE